LNSGLAILSVKSGGLVEILQDDKYTRFISSLHPERLAEEMHDFANNFEPIDFRERKVILERFSDEVIRFKWQSFLRDLKSF
jgi:glycosyltransferase involved in cell wall biosynthesis